jgi:hypothetical protein
MLPDDISGNIWQTIKTRIRKYLLDQGVAAADKTLL